MQYKQIDGLRFFAVFAVVFHHMCAYPILGKFPPGPFGVNLFFVISGFLITEILLKAKISNPKPLAVLKAFFLRRVLRILPLYYLYILICLYFVPDLTRDFSPWLASFTVNIWISWKNSLAFWYFTHLWSICLEEQFYILWPFLILLFPLKKIKYLFLSMIVIAIVYRAWNTFFIVGYDLYNYTMLPTALDCFGAGALLAYLKLAKPELLKTLLNHRYIIPVAFLASILMNIFGTTMLQQSFSRTLTALIAFYLVGLAALQLFNPPFKKILENKIITYLGKISYGIYIYHLLIRGTCDAYLSGIWQFLTGPNYENDNLKMFVYFIFVSLFTILASILSYELFEKRFLHLKKYFNYTGSAHSLTPHQKASSETPESTDPNNKLN